jgi:hypothetical protein
MQNTSTSTPVYTEIHDVPTDDVAVNLVIGKGTATTGYSLIFTGRWKIFGNRTKYGKWLRHNGSNTVTEFLCFVC